MLLYYWKAFYKERDLYSQRKYWVVGIGIAFQGSHPYHSHYIDRKINLIKTGRDIVRSIRVCMRNIVFVTL